MKKILLCLLLVACSTHASAPSKLIFKGLASVTLQEEDSDGTYTVTFNGQPLRDNMKCTFEEELLFIKCVSDLRPVDRSVDVVIFKKTPTEHYLITLDTLAARGARKTRVILGTQMELAP